MTGRAVGFWLRGTGERSSYEQRGLVSMRPVIVPPADPGVVQVLRSHWVCEEPPARHGAGGHEMAFVHQRLLSVHQPDYSSLRRNAREASVKSAAASRSDAVFGAAHVTAVKLRPRCSPSCVRDAVNDCPRCLISCNNLQSRIEYS